MFDPEFAFDGGWRVYSSGPGLVLRLVVESLLGLRWGADDVVVDPVLPAALDGLRATVIMGGGEVRARFSVAGRGHGVESVAVNGVVVDTTAAPRRYREGGVSIARDVWDAAARDAGIDLDVSLR